MGKVLALIVALLLANAACCLAQDKQIIPNNGQHGHAMIKPANFQVKIGDISVDSTFVSLDQIMANPRLVPVNPDVKMLSFYLSIKLKGRDIVGPFYGTGPDFTEEMKKAIRITYGKPETEALIIDDMRLLCNGGDTCKASPIFKRGKRK